MVVLWRRLLVVGFLILAAGQGNGSPINSGLPKTVAKGSGNCTLPRLAPIIEAPDADDWLACATHEPQTTKRDPVRWP